MSENKYVVPARDVIAHRTQRNYKWSSERDNLKMLEYGEQHNPLGSVLLSD